MSGGGLNRLLEDESSSEGVCGSWGVRMDESDLSGLYVVGSGVVEGLPVVGSGLVVGLCGSGSVFSIDESDFSGLYVVGSNVEGFFVNGNDFGGVNVLGSKLGLFAGLVCVFGGDVSVDRKGFCGLYVVGSILEGLSVDGSGEVLGFDVVGSGVSGTGVVESGLSGLYVNGSKL